MKRAGPPDASGAPAEGAAAGFASKGAEARAWPGEAAEDEPAEEHSLRAGREAAVAPTMPGESADLAAPGEPGRGELGPPTPAASELHAAQPGSELGRYQLRSHIGSGGMAEVFRARDGELRRDVALKVLFPHLARDRVVVARFHREARAAASLDHPNILRVYDVGGGVVSADASEDEEKRDPPYIVLEYVAGGTLADLAAKRAPLVAEVVACMGAVIAEALAEVHRAGIVHRDVKPANILLGSGGRLLLSDFGVARVEGNDSLVTRDGEVIGTPSFMSPEQAFGEGQGIRSDLYALGATLYQLATGSVPVSGPMTRALAAIAAGDIPDPLRRNRAVGPDLAAVIRTLMARDPEDRYADAEEVARVLRGVARPLAGEDPGAVVRAYLADSEGEQARARSVAVAGAIEEGESLARRDPTRALALADRVLALDPGNREATALLGRVSSSRRRARFAVAAVSALALAGAGWGVSSALSGGSERAEAGAPGGAVQMSARGGDAGTSDAAPAPAGTMPAASAFGPPPPADAGAVRSEATRRQALRERREAAESPVLPADAGGFPIPDAGLPELPQASAIDAAPAPPPEPAELVVVADAWCDLEAEGERLGRVHGRLGVELPAGIHELSCTQGAGLGTWSQRVELEPGEARRLEIELLAPVSVSVSLTRGDRVRLAGQEVKSGGRLRIRPDRYRVEIYSGGRKLDAGWVSIPRTGACELRDRPSLDCYRQ